MLYLKLRLSFYLNDIPGPPNVDTASKKSFNVDESALPSC